MYAISVGIVSSRLRFFPNFIEDADELFDKLRHGLKWGNKTNKKKDGTVYNEPRLTAWYGDLPYFYSGVVQEPNPKVSKSSQCSFL